MDKEIPESIMTGRISEFCRECSREDFVELYNQMFDDSVKVSNVDWTKQGKNMKQSTRLISERRVRAAIFKTYDQLNPDNKPREISAEVFTALDTALRFMIDDLVEQESCANGRLKDNGHFVCGYRAQEKI